MNIILKKINADRYVVVDDSEIKVGDYYLRYNRSIMKCTSIKLQFNEALNKEETIISSTRCSDPYERSIHFLKKITHLTQPESLGIGLMQSVLPLSLSEVKELTGEVDVEKKAECNWMLHTEGSIVVTDKNDWKSGFHHGYNQALEDNKEKKYTEEDVIRIVEKSRETGLTAEYLMMTSQPKTEWEVEFIDGKLKLI